jgi:uncharacterized damage-inducible protein DinB
MNADAFRHFYNYHFAINREIWDKYIFPLAQEKFTQAVTYSHGSVRNQIVHLMNVDDIWFSEIRGLQNPLLPDLTGVEDRSIIRAQWDNLEHNMRDYLANLRDDMLSTKPCPPGEDENLILWQVLLHVVNHGTDHRAQMLRLLNDLGVKTGPQDYIFYVYDHP